MTKLNDHYFIAWLKVKKKYNFTIVDRKVVVDMTDKEYTELKAEYEKTDKPLLKEIRQVVKELVFLTSQSEKDKI